MLIPKCGKRRLPSNVQYEPRTPSSRQRDSRALTTNQPSPSVTSPFLLLRSGASGDTTRSLAGLLGRFDADDRLERPEAPDPLGFGVDTRALLLPETPERPDGQL